jgi:two-component system response regulator RegA
MSKPTTRSVVHHDMPVAGSAEAFAPDLGPLLLVEASPSSRAFLQRALAARGFTVTTVSGIRPATAAAAAKEFAYAVVNMRLGNEDGIALAKLLREARPSIRIVMVTDVDSFATVILALRAGADAYIAMPIDEGQLVDALFDRMPNSPPVPETPLGLNRTCWEHVMRIYEQCDRNVTRTAQRLGMHRRSLQRFLGKRAPQARAPVEDSGNRSLTGVPCGLPRTRASTLER